MREFWELAIFTFTGMLGLGFLVRSLPEHPETTRGWTPPALFDRREPTPPAVADWPSPASLRKAVEESAEHRPASE
jgi:hypothetical protein